MTLTEIRCTAAHPSAPGRECRQLIANVHPSSVSVVRPELPAAVLEFGPGVIRLQCPRCGAVYLLLPLPVAHQQQAS